MLTLDQLALRHGTDKSSAGHGYTDTYERLLGHLRHRNLTLLELGVWEGASLFMWRDYLPAATIIGVDLHDRHIVEHNIDVLIASQDDPIITDRGPFDVIIDDASHQSALTISSFRLLWPHLAAGGMYVIEDLHTCWNPDYNIGADVTAMQFCAQLADELNRAEFSTEDWLNIDDLESVEFVPNMCIIRKRNGN